MDTPVQETATRDEIRSKVFKSKTPKRKRIMFFGNSIEIVQPLLGDVIDAAKEGNGERSAIITTLIKYAVIPGTETRIFDDSDEEGFNAMPFGEDFSRVMEAFQELTTVNFPAPKPDSKGTP